MQENCLRKHSSEDLNPRRIPLPLIDERRAGRFLNRPYRLTNLASGMRTYLSLSDIVPIRRKPTVPGPIALVRGVPARRLAEAVLQCRTTRTGTKRSSQQRQDGRAFGTHHREVRKIAEMKL